MKSQDILILLKLVSLHKKQPIVPEDFSVRALAAATGIGKTEVNQSLNRSLASGLAKIDRKHQLPKANSKALFELIAYGIRYVFPPRPGEVLRGLLTCFEAPGLKGLVSSIGDYHYVWPDPESSDRGQAIAPLYKTAAFAAKKDPELYRNMALVDAIRLGEAREVAAAIAELEKSLRG